jgi:hypothetical protein
MTQHNQTDPRWITRDNPALGTAVLVIEKPDGSFQINYYPDVAYRRSQRLAIKAIAFKWVPHHVATLEELQRSQCLGLGCVQRCAKPGCVCVETVCRGGDDRWSGTFPGSFPVVTQPTVGILVTANR